MSDKELAGTLLDTFDGGVRQTGRLLVEVPGRLHLVDPLAGNCLGQPVSRPWTFASEIEGGDVAPSLAKVSTLRAFLPVVKLELRLERYCILDELEKTVARASVTVAMRGAKRVSWVSVCGLRGYGDELQLLCKALGANGYTPVAAAADYYPMLGIKADAYESKPRIDLAPDAPIHESACKIAGTFLAVARRNERGVLDDIDTEFVHDYRVSLRRVRSLLGLFKGVFDEGEAGRLKAELAAAMKQTNRLRDLDVYLLDRAGYYKMVPESMHAGLDIMFGVIEVERAEALRAVCGLLQSEEYGRGMDTVMEGVLGAAYPSKGVAAGEPTLHFATRLVSKRYRKISRIAQAIDSSTPDETVHELRIQCKKLRYLMEFFLPLFPEKQVKPLISSLKGLQDVLGRFNDYSVQRDALAAFVEEHPMRGKRGLRLAESVGALVATLYQLQTKARAEVEAGLGQFANAQTARAFSRLCSNKGGK